MRLHFWNNGDRSGMILVPDLLYLSEREVILIEDWKPVEELPTVPKNYISDLGTIPKIFWWIARPEDIKYSSIMHDYCFLLGNYGLYSYKKANLNFLIHCCDWDSIPNWKALILFIGVEIYRLFLPVIRLFGF